ncbi:autotransporter outer membrane beta-barrel domain-containing protein [Bradyrhizobium lablabi]|uniref:autotransporter outer membrane beta-barrel domain-containing protein n=1 Tax=Bradyrhizobium lablabi TaxID=722472 RepID=UPI001BA528A7|nr:autotransporter outer membrane beta-barrel domain-containing protein [Bradyrhizobium lablabi]MBR1121423.1 autotransporter outer membrane beta-barrel domain-containing protein [Bradyrhizobium lablabi]
MEAFGGRLGMWRGALLGSVSLVAMACASDALAACQGVNTGNVLCDAAHPSGGSLNTQSGVDTTVNINAGAGITGGMLVVANGASTSQSVTVNHNDPGGIRNSTFEAILIYNFTPSGAVTYTGSADVVGPLSIKSSGGPVSVTQTSGTVTSVAVETEASGSVDINTVGSRVGFVFARNIGTGGQSDFTIRTGEVTAADANQDAIYVLAGNSRITGRNLSLTTDGNVLGRISMSMMGTGTVDFTTNAGVTGDVRVEATNQASTGAFRINLNQDVTGNVSLSNAGTGTTTVHTRNIAGTLSVGGGGGANSSIVVDGNVNAGTVAAFSSYGGGVASIGLRGGGTNSATFNGAISGTFDASAAPRPSLGGRVTGLGATLGSTSTDGSATLNVNGPVTVTGIGRAGDAAHVNGVSLSTDRDSVVPFDVNLRGSVSATSIGDTAATVFGISASQSRLGTLRLTADGAVTATANAAGSTVTGISVGASAFSTFDNATTFIVRANGDVTATSDGAATGIFVTRGSTSAGVTAGAGGADVISRGTVTANSTSAGAIGVRGLFMSDDTNAATLSLRTEGNVIANGTAAGSYGIFAQRGGLGDLKIEVLAGVQSTGTGIGVTRTNAGNMFITAGSNAAISGVTGVTTSGGTTTLVNYGGITGTGGTAIQFGGTNDVLRMMSGSTVNGNVVGNGTSILQLGGTTAATVNLLQFSGFSNIASLAGSNWSFSGTSNFAGTFNVDGAFTFNGDMSNASVIVGAGGTLGGNGTYGNLVVNGTLSPGNSPGTITTGSLALSSASIYLLQVTGTTSDKIIVTGTANIDGKVVVDPLERLLKKTTYTIINAGTLNGTFTSASVAGTSNFARNAILSYVGNDVLVTVDPGLLSPVLSANAPVNHRNVAGGIDNALLGGANLSNAFSAIFNLSGNALENGLTQISGETATGTQQTTFNAMNQFMGTLLDPFIDGRGAAASAGGAPNAFADEEALAYAAKRSNNDAYAAIYRKAPLAAAYDPRWSVWAAAYGGSQSTSGNAVVGSNDTTSRLFGTAVGFDYRFSPNTIAGFALAGGGTNFGVTGGGSGRSDLFQAGAFVRHNTGAGYVAGALAYGWQDVTTDRTVTVAGIDRLRAEFNANAWSGRVEGGYRFVAPWIGGVGFTPYAAGQFTTFDLPAYAEQAVAGNNTFALAYNSKSVTNTRSELGLRTDKSFALDGAVLTLRGRAAWAHDFNPDRNIAATFQTLPGSSFVVNGAAQAPNSALTTASAEVKWMNGWSALASFECEFSSVTRSYAGKGVVRYAW